MLPRDRGRMAMTTGSRAIGRDVDLGPFQAWALVYATAIMLEMLERWRDVPAATLMLVWLGLLVWRTNVASFALYVLFATLYFVFFKFPEAANHVNLTIFSNIAILIAIALRWRDGEARVFAALQPALRLLIIGTFTVAGFHKLNADFVNPAVSCAGRFGYAVYRALMTDPLGTGVPSGVALAGILIGAVLVYRRGSRRIHMPPVDWRGVAAPVVTILAMGTAVLALVGTEAITGPVEAVVIFVAIMVLSWQLVEGPLLLIPRFQWVAITFSLGVHATIAMAQVVDFQSIAIALLLTFVPPQIWEAWRRGARIGTGALGINRAAAYLAINLFAGILMLVNYQVVEFMDPAYVVGGVIYNFSLVVLFWPILVDLFSGQRKWRWTGVPVLGAEAPKLTYLLPVALVLFGLTSHLGLRTAGNFSMFSNLRTEGDVSNHLLFGSNPIKIWGYQEDLVEIVEADPRDRNAGFDFKVALDPGYRLPVVEFRKILHHLHETGRVVPMTIRYQGETIVSADIAREPGWVVPERDWEMRLLDFRVIQPDGPPNECRW
jgi:hypothetical protein